jgi:LytR cell envelope-related transcriptional attenuator
VNTGTTRIIIVAALVVAGFVVLVNGFPSVDQEASGGPGTGTSTSPTASVSPSETETPPPEPPPDPQPPKKIHFFVLNGTNSTGLAGIEAEHLANQELTPALNAADSAADDAPTKGQKKTIVYFRGGDEAEQNQADAQWVADTYYDGATVKELDPDVESDVVPAEANVVVLLGEDSIPSA